MLYVYDNAIVDDIKSCINSENANPNVVMADADNYPGIIAQMQDDTITYPLILVQRDEDMPIITELANFSRAQFGIPAAFDNKTNTIFYERSLPVDLQYTIRILSHNVFDTDELARELFFRYLSMYYLTIQLPYESDRKLRFGIEVDLGHGIKRESGNSQYLKSGAVYQSTLHIKTQGCLMLSYSGRHLTRNIYDTSGVDIEPPTGPSKK